MRGLIVATALALSSQPAAGQRGPATLPLHDPAYSVLEGLENSGCAAARVSPYRPYAVTRIRAAIRIAADDPACAGRLLAALQARFDPKVDSASLPTITGEAVRVGSSHALNEEQNIGAALTARATGIGRGEFRPFSEDLRATSDGDPPFTALLRVRGRYSPTPSTAAVIEGFAESDISNDPLVRAGSLRSTSGAVGISEATFAVATGPLIFSFGRDREVWLGRDTESLILSGNAPPLDRLQASLNTKHFEARALYALLNDVVIDTLHGELSSGTPSQRFYRTLAAHGLTWRPSGAFEISVGESVLLSRGSRTLEFGYANPLMPYILTQNDAAADGNRARDNLVVFSAARARFGRSLLVGEVLVDDIQIDADREITPNQLAWRLEARQGWSAMAPGSAGVEYERVDGYTYLRSVYTDVYQYADRPLGSELGTDADRLRGFAEIWPTGTFRLTTSVGVWRRGAQRLSRRPSVGATGNAGGSFPTTTDGLPFAQRALLGDLTASVTRWDVPVTLTLEGARIQNAGNISTGSSLYVRAHLSATYAFRYP